jgi:hypothetical protein
MSPLLPLAAYAAAAGTLVSGVALSLSVLMTPGGAGKAPDDNQQLARSGPKPIVKPKADSTPFRYGPDVNHGRSDTPVYAAAQARKESQRLRVVVRKRGVARPAAGQDRQMTQMSSGSSISGGGMPSGH